MKQFEQDWMKELEEEDPEGYKENHLWQALYRHTERGKLLNEGKAIPRELMEPGSQNKGEEYQVRLSLMGKDEKFKKSQS
jgi:hypothetical protein